MGTKAHDRSEILGECMHCSRSITTGISIEFHEEDTERSISLCEDCATLDCPHCKADIDFEQILPETGANTSELTKISCQRCDESVALSNAVELRQQDDKQYRKRICGDCLEEIGVPPGFQVIRDLGPD